MMSISIYSLDYSIYNNFFGDQDTLISTDMLGPDGINLSDTLGFEIDSKYVYTRNEVTMLDFSLRKKDFDIMYLDFFLEGKVPFCKILAGTNFYSRYALSGAKLYVLDQTPFSGTIAGSGLALFSELPIGNTALTAKMGAGCGLGRNFDDADSPIYPEFGFDLNYDNHFSIGLNAKLIRSILYGNYTIAGGVHFDNINFNTGFIYNATTDWGLPFGSLYAVYGSFLYTSTDNKLKTGIDVVCGLTNTSIINNKKIIENEGETYPIYTAASVKYRFGQYFEQSLKIGYKDGLAGTVHNQYCLDVYPYGTLYLWNDRIQLSSGVRLLYSHEYEDETDLTGKGDFKLSLPITFSVKFGNK